MHKLTSNLVSLKLTKYENAKDFRILYIEKSLATFFFVVGEAGCVCARVGVWERGGGVGSAILIMVKYIYFNLVIVTFCF